MGKYNLKNKCIFLDRDGVLNEVGFRNTVPVPPKSIEDLKIKIGVKSSIKKLKLSGYLLIVVTNQPDYARGTQTKKNIEMINEKINNILVLDDIFVCWHGYDDECNCRKPKIGLFKEAEKKYSINMKKSFMIGDRSKDIEAGKTANCKTILIKTNYENNLKILPDYSARNFSDATKYILNLT